MAWSSFVSSARLTCDADYESFHDGSDAIVITLNPRELMTMAFSIASEVGEVDDLSIQILGGSRVVVDSVTQTITSATVLELADAANELADYYMGLYALMTSGGETKDLRLISDLTTDGSTPTITLERALSGTPTTTETCSVFHMSAIAEFIIKAETTLTEADPQNGIIQVMGYNYIIARAKSTGGTNAHIALMTYQKDGVSAA